jgi:hypothetical protein
MKTRPILFSGSMVRAILSGAKTQTRRVLDPQPRLITSSNGTPIWHLELRNGFVNSNDEKTWPESMVRHHVDQDGNVYPAVCPFGAPGDRLWVRETWGVIGDIRAGSDGEHFAAHVEYAADLAKRTIDVHMDHWRTSYEMRGKWRPSIHMPRWASRLTLEVTSVRVERLHDISEDDARAEGVDPFLEGGYDFEWVSMGGPCRANFRRLWEGINGPGSWEANPWVWVVSFRRVDTQQS